MIQLINNFLRSMKRKLLAQSSNQCKYPNERALADIPNTTISIVQHYIGSITPDTNTIFVFGSNPEGRHGHGAARVARMQFGDIYGQGEGLQGNAYALPTKDLRVKKNHGLRSIPKEQITKNIKRLYHVARQNPTKQFKIAYRNKPNETTLNGYTGAEMIEMFNAAGTPPSNIIFSEEWYNSGLLITSTENVLE